MSPVDDALDLRMRLVDLFFSRAFGVRPADVWHAPSPLVLLGGQEALAILPHWRVMVAASAREDDVLRLYLLEHPEEPLEVALDADPASLPEEAAAVAGVARVLRRRGIWRGGADLLTYADVPDGSGLAVSPGHRAAVARALAGASGTDPADEEILEALDEAAGSAAAHAAHAASVYGREGSAIHVPSLRQVRFNPAAARMRLMIIALRAAPAAPPPSPAVVPDGDAARAVEAFAALAALTGPDLGPALGALLTASHEEARAGREALETDTAVAAAFAAGAFGARSTSSRSAVALVPTPLLGEVRRAVATAVTALGQPVPRFLTTAGLAAPAEA